MKKRKRKDSKNALTLLLLALVLSLYLFLNSDMFTVTQIEWTGLTRLAEDNLDDYAEFEPINVLRLDHKALTKELKQHPWVEDVHLRWRWPNYIKAIITERTPIARLKGEDGWHVLDQTGFLIPFTEEVTITTDDLIVITHVEPNLTNELSSAARVLVNIPPHLLDYFLEWDAKRKVLIAHTGTEVIIGEPEELAIKFSYLELIMEDLDAQEASASTIDLRIPNKPVITII